MEHLKRILPICIILPLVAGCAPVQKYRPAPISPPGTAASFESRTLLDPELKPFVEQNLGHTLSEWPPKTWDLPLLTLAAFYFHPSLAAARARVAIAEAAIVTAGARPNPTVTLAPGIPKSISARARFRDTHRDRGQATVSAG